MSNDTYGMRDQINAPLELPPFQSVAWDPGSILSKKKPRLLGTPKEEPAVSKLIQIIIDIYHLGCNYILKVKRVTNVPHT